MKAIRMRKSGRIRVFLVIALGIFWLLFFLLCVPWLASDMKTEEILTSEADMLPAPENGEAALRSIVMKTMRAAPFTVYDYLCWGILVLLSFALVLLYHRPIPIWTLIRKILPYAFVIGVTLLAVYSTTRINKKTIDACCAGLSGITMIAAFALVILISFLAYRADRKAWPAEKFFLLLYIPISLTMMFVFPISRAPDEADHLKRIYAVSTGQFLPASPDDAASASAEILMPENLLSGLEAHDFSLTALARIRGESLSAVRVGSGDTANTGIYPINSYFPQALGMALVRLFTLNRVAILYAARFGGWAMSIMLLYYAIKKIPAGKYALIAIALLPMTLQEIVSASVDGMAFGMTAAFIAFCVDALLTKRKFTSADYTLLFLLSFGVVTFKVMYCLFALLMFCIPNPCFGSARKKKWVTTSVLAVIFLLIIAWSLLCVRRYAQGTVSHNASQVIPQLKNMIVSPYTTLRTLLNTLARNMRNYIETLVGTSLSWFNISLSDKVLYFMLFMIVYIFSHENALTGDPYKSIRRGMTCLSVLGVGVIFVFLLLWYTPPGDTIIQGIQGRYFIPLLFPFLLGVKKSGAPFKKKSFAVYTMAACDIYMMAQVLRHTIL